MNDSFFTISNAEILTVSIWCLFSFLLVITFSKSGIFRKYFDPMLTSRVTVPLLLCFQFISAFFLPAYRNVVITYLFLFLVGINLYSLITPSFLRRGFSYFVLIPLNGLALVSIVGAYFIGFDIKTFFLAPTLLGMTLFVSIIQFKFSREKIVSILAELKTDFGAVLIVYTGIITPIIFCLILPVLISDYSTSVYRIGPDLTVYASMAQFFIDGGTWTEASKRGGEFVGMSLAEIIRYTTSTMYWPVMHYHRWGLTAYQSTTAVITFTKHSYGTAFTSLVVPHLLHCGLVLIWIRNQFGLGIMAAALGAVAFTFNANLINLWYEGFYANSFAFAFFVPVLYTFVHYRNEESVSRGDFIRSISFLSVLIAASLMSFPEAIVFISVVFVSFIFIVDLVYNRGIKWSPYLILLFTGIVGVLIVLPCDFLKEWAMLAFKQLFEQGGNGYMQPFWALPSEILGLQNIYLNISPALAGKLLHRSTFDLVSACIFSGLAFYFIFVYLRRNHKAGNILYLASILMVAVVALLVLYKSPFNNYMFMKMYVFHLPYLFLIFWGSLCIVCESHFAKLIHPSSNWIYLFIATIIVASGLIYVIQYKNQSSVMDKSRIDFHEDFKRIDFNKVVLYTPFSVTNRFMYSPILPIPWMDSYQWKDSLVFRNYIDYKVYLFFEKQSGYIYACNSKDIVFENQQYLIMDSGNTVRDGLDTESDSINFEVYTKRAPGEISAQKQAHNLEFGLPVDFDPVTYLRLNPQVLEYFESKGIIEKGEPLFNRAESHYKSFGVKEELKYK